MKEIPPLEMSIHVRCGVEAAFRLFTEGIAKWWPLSTHSVAQAQAKSLVFEGRIGGEIYEVTAEGQRHLWGTVVLWEPPQRVAFSWHPGREEDTGQEVELRFQTAGDVTEVSLSHRGWENLGELGEKARADYAQGWGNVFGRIFKEAADAVLGERTRP